MSHRIALVHATPLAIQPIEEAFQRAWPKAATTNLLDDALSPDLAAVGDVTPAITRRIIDLARYAHSTGAHGVLFTCSAFGAAIDQAKRTLPVPVLKPNEAMIDDALAVGDRIALIVTFAPTLRSMEDEFKSAASALNRPLELTTVHVPGAIEALQRGDDDEHDRLIAKAAASVGACDALVLGQFSMARAQALVSRGSAVPVLTTPESAVRRMRSLLDR